MKSVIITVVVLLMSASVGAQEQKTEDPKVLELERTVAAQASQITQLQKAQSQPREAPEESRTRRKQSAKDACGAWGLRFDRLHITGTTVTVVCK